VISAASTFTGPCVGPFARPARSVRSAIVGSRSFSKLLLAALSDWNPSLCRHAAFDSDHWEPFVQRLLLGAAEERD
jgi:hypothetical protein